MISSTLGAPFGGMTRAGQYGLDSAAFRAIVPPNFCGGGGICLPSIVVVALADPGTPVVFSAEAPPPPLELVLMLTFLHYRMTKPDDVFAAEAIPQSDSATQNSCSPLRENKDARITRTGRVPNHG